jgi:hypothetical protein
MIFSQKVARCWAIRQGCQFLLTARLSTPGVGASNLILISINISLNAAKRPDCSPEAGKHEEHPNFAPKIGLRESDLPRALWCTVEVPSQDRIPSVSFAGRWGLQSSVIPCTADGAKGCTLSPVLGPEAMAICDRPNLYLRETKSWISVQVNTRGVSRRPHCDKELVCFTILSHILDDNVQPLQCLWYPAGKHAHTPSSSAGPGVCERVQRPH